MSAKCGKGAHVLNVNGGLKPKILGAINILRNYVASGVGNFSIAARMPVMKWDHHLQRMANFQIRQCDNKTSFCANIRKYHYVATIEIRGTMRRRGNLVKVVVDRMLPDLFNDLLGCKMDENQQMKPLAEGRCNGHYTPLIEDHGSRMGCAILVKPLDEHDPKQVSIVLLCHFSRANVNGMPHYEVGTTATEKCRTGADQLYQFLCSTAEEVNANKLVVKTAQPDHPDEISDTE
ncbi:uncharacterized protein Dana_GF12003 [Drosophila ananassae]|uniref:SCP domain-containing protein n=2 Tax=Drosophila ananassae TaxID=7217 RepID=B3MD40_DROAN|nr:uncharacterized protein Dana_GF12003 [Drosophila ananassae]